jgi:O-antigen/teichoic acid export membrane protein
VFPLIRNLQLKVLGDHTRTALVGRSILGVSLIRGGSVIVNLLTVAYGLSYLEQDQFGVWVTLSSIFTWMGVLDVGLGNGLRNRFAEAIANDDHFLARKYVSTAYVLVGIAVFSFVAFYLVAHPFLQWSRILNFSAEPSRRLNDLVLICVVLFGVRLLLRLVNTIALANQQAEVSEVIDFTGVLVSLGGIILLSKTTNSSLLAFGILVTLVPLLVTAIASIILFGSRYRAYRPSLSHIDFALTRRLAGLGLQFFIINLSGLVIFSASNVVIAQLLGPSEVSAYYVAFRYFSIVVLISNVLLAPMWSAFTDAYARGDVLWIRGTVRRLATAWVALCAIVVLMLALSGPIYKIWIGSTIQIGFGLSLACALYVVLFTWNSIFAYFINGVGRIRLQLYSSVIAAALYVPFSLVLGKSFDLGSSGVVLASCISLGLGAIWAPIQYRKLVSGTAKGIWAQ